MSDRDLFQRVKRDLSRTNKGVYMVPKFYGDALAYLSISNSHEVIDLGSFTVFQNLQGLIIQNNNFAVLNLDPLEELSHLKSLIIKENQFLDTMSLKIVRKLPELNFLSINRNAFKALDLFELSHARQLVELNLREISGAANYRDPENMSYYDYWRSKRYYQDCEAAGYNRYDLDLDDCHSYLKTLDLRFLAKHPSLQEVNLSLNGGVKETLFPESAPLVLEELNLSDNDLSQIDLGKFSTPYLQKLTIARSNVERISLNGLEKASDLYYFSLKHNLLDDIDLTPLSEGRELKILELSRNRLKNIDLSPLKKLQHLKVLDLESNDLQSINLEAIREMRELQVLRLGDNLLTNVDLSPLRGNRSLRILRLTRNNLRFVDLEPLEDLTMLQKVQIARNQLEKLSLEPLRGKQYINEINLDRNQFVELNIEALEDIPGVDFIDLTNATTRSKVDITSILSHQSHAWVQLGEELDLTVDVDKIKDVEIMNSRLVEHEAVEKAIDFKKNSKKLLDSKTDYFAVKAVENHEDIDDLMTQRLIENRFSVADKIAKRLKELHEDDDD